VSSNWIHILIWAALIGAAFIVLWWQGQVARLALYCRETWVELQKCNWPNRDELKGSTALIMVMIVMLSAYIVLIDLILTSVFFHR
jgi:preprotein translocase SecE subunit